MRPVRREPAQYGGRRPPVDGVDEQRPAGPDQPSSAPSPPRRARLRARPPSACSQGRTGAPDGTPRSATARGHADTGWPRHSRSRRRRPARRTSRPASRPGAGWTGTANARSPGPATASRVRPVRSTGLRRRRRASGSPSGAAAAATIPSRRPGHVSDRAHAGRSPRPIMMTKRLSENTLHPKWHSSDDAVRVSCCATKGTAHARWRQPDCFIEFNELCPSPARPLDGRSGHSRTSGASTTARRCSPA